MAFTSGPRFTGEALHFSQARTGSDPGWFADSTSDRPGGQFLQRPAFCTPDEQAARRTETSGRQVPCIRSVPRGIDDQEDLSCEQRRGHQCKVGRESASSPSREGAGRTCACGDLRVDLDHCHRSDAARILSECCRSRRLGALCDHQKASEGVSSVEDTKPLWPHSHSGVGFTCLEFLA